jgi:hypothetical protein
VLVGELARRGLIGDLVGRTTGELLDDVRRAAPPAVPPYTAVTYMFEETWYGGAAVGSADRDRFASLAAEVVALAGRAAAAGPR